MLMKEICAASFLQAWLASAVAPSTSTAVLHMSRIDYSKWDKIEDSDDEEDKPRGAPQVTKFDAPMSVTFGDQESAAGGPPPSATGPDTHTTKRGATPSSVSVVSSSSSPTKKRRALPDIAKLSEDGAELEKYLWSQTKTEAVLSVWVPPGTKAREVCVDLRNDGDDKRLVVSLASQKDAPLIDAKLANPIKVDPDTGLEWEVIDGEEEDSGRRLLRVTFSKSAPRDDMVHWWSRMFEGDPEVDTTAIKGRSMNFRDAWNEAQAKFMESVKNRKPVSLEDVMGSG